MPREDFWTEQRPLFTAQFPAYYRSPQEGWGRFHTSQERYASLETEIIPLREKTGERTYILMHPYVHEPSLRQARGLREKPVGNAQAWYYPSDTMLVLWECFLIVDCDATHCARMQTYATSGSPLNSIWCRNSQ